MKSVGQAKSQMIYLVINYNFDSTAGAFSEMNSLDSEFVIKYTRNFRF